MAEKDIHISLAEKSLNEIEKINDSLGVLTNEIETLPDNLKPLYEFIQNQSDMKDSIMIKSKNKIYTVNKKLFDKLPYGSILFYILKKINRKLW